MPRCLLSISLLLLYLVPVFGVQATGHYCGQRLESVSLSGSDEKGCCADSQQMPAGCCHDQVVKMQVSDDQQATASFDLPVFSFVWAELPSAAPITLLRTLPAEPKRLFSPVCHAPPRSAATPIYLANRMFRI